VSQPYVYDLDDSPEANRAAEDAERRAAEQAEARRLNALDDQPD
jgi:hypothetical protein